MQLQNVTDRYARELFDTARSVFENAAFAIVDDPDTLDDLPPHCGDDELVAARVRFQGPFSGTMALAMPAPLACALAAGMLGLEPDDPEAILRRGDTVGELLNMVCGNLLPAIAGTDPEFAILAPEPAEPAVCRALVAAHPAPLKTTTILIADDAPVHAALLLDPRNPNAN